MLKKEKGYIYSDIILTDVISFSKLTSMQQLEIITYLSKSYRSMVEKMLENSGISLSELILGFISTGDGFFCILNPKLKGYGAIIALSFNYFSDQISRKYPYFKGVKTAVHTGEMHEFKDILGHTNYIGDGLNDCARYLEIKNYKVSTVMISDIALENFKEFINKHLEFNHLLVQKEFKRSSMYTFYDKHGGEKKGCLIWLRQAGIINPKNTNFNSILNT